MSESDSSDKHSDVWDGIELKGGSVHRREVQIISQDSCGTRTNTDNTHARSARRQPTFACVVNNSSGCELEDVVKFNFYNISSSFEVLESGQKIFPSHDQLGAKRREPLSDEFTQCA